MIGAQQVDPAGAPGLDDGPGFIEVAGQAQLGSEDIHGADRQDAQGRVGAHHAVDHFVDRPIAARGDDRREALLDGGLGHIAASPGAEVARMVQLGSFSMRRQAALARSLRAAGLKMTRISCMRRGRFRLFFQRSRATLCGVKKVSKAILIGLAVLVALGVALIVGLNLYIQSPGSQARIQEELSKLLRLPLKLTNVSVSPFGSLRVTGLTIPNGGANFLDAASFNARYRLLSLLQGKLVITEMNVESPKIVWIQAVDGKMAAARAPTKRKACPRRKPARRWSRNRGKPSRTSPRPKPGRPRSGRKAASP